MFTEKWEIYGVKHVKFDSAGDSVEGYQVFYRREPYDATERQNWSLFGVCPSKPQWVSVELGERLCSIVRVSGSRIVSAVYEPKGRFNRLVDFEEIEDEKDDSFDI